MTKLLISAVVGALRRGTHRRVGLRRAGPPATATAFLRLQNPADLDGDRRRGESGQPLTIRTTQQIRDWGDRLPVRGGFRSRPWQGRWPRTSRLTSTLLRPASRRWSPSAASGGSADEAVRTVQTAIDLYGQELARRIDDQLRTVLPALSEWQQRDSGGRHEDAGSSALA